MACTPIGLNGISLSCSAVGGLSKIFVMNAESLSGVTFSADGIVTGMTTIDDAKFALAEFKKSNANFTSETTQTPESSNYYVTTTLTVTFNKIRTEIRNFVLDICKTPTLILALDANSKFWLIGYSTPTYGTGSSSYCTGNAAGNTGAALADANNFVLTITSITNELPYEVSSACALLNIVEI